MKSRFFCGKFAKVPYFYDGSSRLIKSSDGMTYFYDHIGVAGFKYNDARYVYQKDALGNFVAILDNTGATVVKYVYDAWGNHKAYDANNKLLSSSGRKKYTTAPTQLCDINPFKYRGYFYDYETGLYYLKTRYYDPETGRFINMDSFYVWVLEGEYYEDKNQGRIFVIMCRVFGGKHNLRMRQNNLSVYA